MAVGVLAHNLPSRQLILLQKVLAADLFVAHRQGKLGEQVGSELHVTLAGAEQLVQAEIRLHGAGRATVPEISGAALTHQLAALCDIVAQLLGSGSLEHLGVWEINQGVVPNVVDAHEIGLDIRVEESLVSALDGLGVGAATTARALDGVEILGLLHEDDTHVALHRPRLPNLRMGVGPARQAAGHLRPRRHRAVHPHGPERPE